MRYLLMFFLAAMIISACDTVDEVTPIAGFRNIFDHRGEPDTMNIFSVSVDPSFTTDQSDDWVIISNLEGQVLGYSSFETNTTFDIEAFVVSVPGLVNVSLLQILFSDTRTSYSIQSYANIKTTIKWHITRPVETNRNSLGEININIINSPEPSLAYYKVSDDFGGQSYSYSWSSVKRLTTFGYTLFEDVAKIIITVTTPENEIKYLEIEDPTPFLNYTYDYNTDFESPDFIANIQLGMNNYVSASIRGMNDLLHNKSVNRKGLGITNVVYLTGTDELALGYNSGYAYYYTELAVSTRDYLYTYEKLGDAPDLAGISVTPNPITSINDDFLNFDFSGGEEYDHLQIIWERNETINGKELVFQWKINTSHDQFPYFSEMPEEIEREYPFLDFNYNELRLENIKLVKNMNGYSYQEMIDDLIRSNQEDYRPHEYESISKGF